MEAAAWGDALTKLCADGPLALRGGTVSAQGCACSLSNPVGGAGGEQELEEASREEK